MSDYTITGASASYNPTTPAPIPENSSVTIDISLTYAGTIVDPIDLVAEATCISGDAVSWTQVVSSTVTAATLEFTVTATSSPVLQPTSEYRQNYLVSLTDADDRNQVFNIALDNEDGYPTATLEVIAGYPSPRGIATTPATPTALTNTQITSTRYDLSWTAGSGGASVTGYKIARAVRSGATTGTFAILVSDTTTTAVTYSNTGLSTYARYVYKVAAINSIIGTSAYSDASYTITELPTALSATAVGTDRIDLSWTAPSDNGGTTITGYRIERESPTGGGFAVIVASTGLTTTTYSNTLLSAGTEYNYRVSAINAVGVTGPSVAASDTTDP